METFTNWFVQNSGKLKSPLISFVSLSPACLCGAPLPTSVGILFISAKAIEFCAKLGFIVAVRTECVCTNTLTVLVTAASKTPISQIHSILTKEIKHTLKSREYTSLDIHLELNGWLPCYQWFFFFLLTLITFFHFGEIINCTDFIFFTFALENHGWQKVPAVKLTVRLCSLGNYLCIQMYLSVCVRQSALTC